LSKHLTCSIPCPKSPLMKVMTLLMMLVAAPLLANDPPKSFPTLSAGGKTYRDVTVKAVQPDALRIVHAEGFARIPFEQLSPELQQQFGFDPGKASQHREDMAQKTKEATAKELSAAQAEKEKKSNIAASQKMVIRVDQSVDGGIVGREIIDDSERDFDTGTLTISNHLGDQLFVAGIENIADGEVWSGRAYRDGNWKRKAIDGTLRHLPKWMPVDK
jgi:hypothetical protein